MIDKVEVKKRGIVEQGYWHRQFEDDATGQQLAYDVIFGVVMPILCFVFDPVVFDGSGFADTIVPLSQLGFLIYLFSALSIITLVAWLLAARALKSYAGFFAGVLLTGALLSFLIGVLILPLTLMGLAFLIGILGFTPFLTAFVYLRNGIRAKRIAESSVSRKALLGMMMAGALVVITIPVAAHVSVNRLVNQSMNELMQGDAQATERAVARLRYVRWFTNMNKLVWAYSKEHDETRKRNLARAYKQLTGVEIEDRLQILLD